MRQGMFYSICIGMITSELLYLVNFSVYWEDLPS